MVYAKLRVKTLALDTNKHRKNTDVKIKKGAFVYKGRRALYSYYSRKVEP